MVMSFCAVLFPRGVLDEILKLIESVSEGFPSYFPIHTSFLLIRSQDDRIIYKLDLGCKKNRQMIV